MLSRRVRRRIHLPGYALTGVASKLELTYEDWRTVLAAAIEAEAARRLPVRLRSGMGGMLGYDATARTRLPKGLFVTCLTGLRNPAVRRGVARWPWLGTCPVLCRSLPTGTRHHGSREGSETSR
jgi:hypothetical protein